MTSLYYIPQGWNRAEDPRIRRLLQEGRKKNSVWLNDPPRAYWGRWVVLGDGQVLGQGRNREEAIRNFQANKKKAHALLVVPIEPTGAIFGVYTK